MRRRAPPSSRSFLGVADPVTTVAGETLAPLPFAGQEVDSVAGLFPESDRRVLTGADAARATIRSLDLRRYRFVHFATHGWLDPGEWQDSGLWLSPASAGGPAEILSVEDTLSLSLDAELVVLSACRSGAGEMLNGEGLVGLTRAFLHSGSRGVVVSLWAVPDQSTADLMGAFYGAVRRGKSASTALREAKLELLRSTVPGRNRIARWAGFVLVGVHGPPSTSDGGR
jgi:CHAT domain-containing protein